MKNVIQEILELIGYGENPPKELMDTIYEFRRRKCAISPKDLSESDIVFCTMLYDMKNGNKKELKAKK